MFVSVNKLNRLFIGIFKNKRQKILFLHNGYRLLLF
ncbi:hypothetical protein HD_1079 [[Haemophilus] ducreyi 35000HP]|uniref:Uncharacterized protein n=1 Tax=Haemophilus ducreyi (strain 35000HP / ATCC 700724) TaxID=233412 RepID=Q7VMB1_HAEDU|nr:hypothetical protein HD_1079 [[Haemophilus] ducreyi 35000HP]